MAKVARKCQTVQWRTRWSKDHIKDCVFMLVPQLIDRQKYGLKFAAWIQVALKSHTQ